MKKINVILMVASLAIVSGALAVECPKTMICNNTNRDVIISGVMAGKSQNPQISAGITPVSMTLAPYSKHTFDSHTKIESGKMRCTAVLGKNKLSNVTEPMEIPGSYEITMGSGNMLRVKPMNSMDMGKVSMAD